ncbi:hypothetical protein I9W82_001971 [Candida metapsilosis]|uniref:Rrn9 domain-containing protein n=1 Tax=Candida metapsilosis TaxID=273372 RepID=A0A8H7ZJF9_9ASCO|nr:hypothetical protein I9W82_001971 [Candida metapsilosis]
MSQRQERERILHSLEHDFINDLSQHLYSTFLLHRINPNFPLPRWANWPKQFDKVPVPSSKYEDDLIDAGAVQYEWDIDEDQLVFERDRAWQVDEMKNKRKTAKERSEVSNGDEGKETEKEVDEEIPSSLRDDSEDDSSDSGSSDADDDSSNSSDSEDSAESDDELNYNEDQLLDPHNKIVEVAYTERIPQAKTCLINALTSLLESNIRHKITALKQSGKIDASLIMTSESITSKNMVPYVGHLANRFNSMLDTMFDTFHRKDYPLNWQHVVMAGMINDRKRVGHGKFNSEMYERLLRKCEDVFLNVHNVYEFEEEDEEEEEADTRDVVTEDGGFNVVKYLESLREEYVGPGQKEYAVLANDYLREFNAGINFKSRLKQNMLNMMHEGVSRKRRRSEFTDEVEWEREGEGEEAEEVVAERTPTDSGDQHEFSNLNQRRHHLLQQQKELIDSYTINI